MLAVKFPLKSYNTSCSKSIAFLKITILLVTLQTTDPADMSTIITIIIVQVPVSSRWYLMTHADILIGNEWSKFLF